MKRYAIIILLVAIAAFAAWRVIRPQDGPQAHAERRAGPLASPVTTVLAGRADIPVTRRSIGFAEPVAIVAVKSRLDGVIADMHVKEGQEVRQGDLLFTLDDRELKAQVARDEANVERDKATVAQKRADLARQKSLVDKGAGTQQALDQATADEAVANAAVKADEATLALDRVRLGYTTITAPISGRLGAITATPGNAVRANDASSNLVTVTELAPIRVTFTLPERDLTLLQAAAKASTPAKVTAYASGTREELATGDLSFIDSAVDIPSGTVSVKALFANDPHRLWPGQYVDVVVQLGMLSGSVTVPSVALQEGQKGPFVYVTKSDDTVEARPVKVASNENGVAALASGLSQDEKVVTEGQSRLSPGARIRLTAPQSAKP
ncbi:efflux RND transporter periplasmic adaptor subunit [Bosea sp. (in: a-proteobacteria)]|jgi:multidrug efflux system membrane fusion protein|uniref:efflux RND transporter periplasmic adaptor subunit n=1 Tax=Bosea sp. (in: a-proteobacteria) TaxID=1871050 RepID=UPI002DDD193F|nr:efflux RND transporter periplasmic adaptor subunit [Bosea sp. (in: a-proteobacteria)]HEV2513552.1 efflux RND transporter periplasmic adaptor subunit [Bosea sp. (in: a-proteobacteria)]